MKAGVPLPLPLLRPSRMPQHRTPAVSPAHTLHRARRGPARLARLPLLAALALLGACATRAPERDGPPANPPAGLERLPDAQPRVEPIRAGGPNKPYEVQGRRYVPFTEDLPLRQVGGASWYGTKFHGKPTSSGEPYDMLAMTAAHTTMPIPSYARVRNPANGREVVVRVNDRGPFVPGRVIDLSYAAAAKLGLLRGVAPVEVLRLTHAEIRSGFWRDAAAPGSVNVPMPVPASVSTPVPQRPPLLASNP